MKDKAIGLIVALENYDNFINQNEYIINELSKKFEKIYVINVIKLKIGNKNLSIKNNNNFPTNFIIKIMDTSSEFISFFKGKDFVGIQYLSKNPSFYKIYYLIKKCKIKNILVLNLSNYGNKQTIDWNLKYLFKGYKHYYEKGFYYIFRLLTLVNIFPKIDLLFESDLEIIHRLNNGFSRNFENKFPFFKVSYFRKIIKVNSVFFDHFHNNIGYKSTLTENKILYVDTPIDHPDRIHREGTVSENAVYDYYERLNIFLKQISKTFEMDIVICLHPKNKNKLEYFNDFEISKIKTIDMIPKSEIIIFSLSSAVLNSVMYKKKIINITSSHLGDYLLNINNKYVKALNLFTFNIDNDFSITKDDCINKMNNSLNTYESFIKKKIQVDNNTPSAFRIIETIKENFF